jgi:MOSC domain-containing protein YiiM
MSRVVEILIASAPLSTMENRDSVRAVPGRGLEGDRYFLGLGTFSPIPHKPDYEVTLIQKEHIENFQVASALPFTSKHARRNLVSEGVDLNSLVGKDFDVGSVRLRGIRLCEPCNHLAKSSFPAVLQGLVHKGGLRAQILSEGVIHVGDPLTVT